MARVSYLNFPPGYEELWRRVLQPGDRFQFSRVRARDIFLSRAKIKGITQRSQMVELKPIWAGFSGPEQAAWSAAGAESGLTGWKQFLVDTCERRKAGHTGYATPSTLYQAEVGRISVQTPASGLRIEQPHPSSYYVRRKVPGTQSQYQPVLVYEPFSVPLTIAISWKTALVAHGDNPRARFFVRVYSTYQGRDIDTDFGIEFGLTDDWQRDSATLTKLVGLVRGYSAFIEVVDARGDVYFDNIRLIHDSQNWARDPACNSVSTSFTRAFYQVPKNWAPVNASNGTDYGSYYFIP